MKRLSSAGQSHSARQDSSPNCARTSFHARILTILLLLLTLFLTVGVPGLAYAQMEPPASDLESPEWKTGDKIGPGVRETLEAEGSVRVVVALETPGSLKRPDRSKFPQIRRDVEAGQNAVIGQLAAGEHSMRRRYRMTPAFAADIHTLSALDRLERHPLVVKIDLDEKMTAHLAQSVPLIRADSMHARGYTGEGVVVAILDTGIDTDHPDLVDDLIHEECFMSGPYCHNGLDRQSGPGAAEDNNGHGTHVAGTITSTGIVSSIGVAPDAQIVAIKILDAGGSGWAADIIAGLDWILEYGSDVDLINLSLGAGLFGGECDLIAAQTLAFAEVFHALRTNGVTSFASSGNDHSPSYLALPACLSSVVSVGATDDVDDVATFTNSNPYLDLLAPGVNIVADLPGGLTGSGSGTSMASPHAVGCAALQMEAGRAATPGTIEAWMKGSGVPVVDPKNGLTFPRVDCFAEPILPSSDELLASAGPPDGTGECGGTGTYTVDVIDGTISRTGDAAFNNWAVGQDCWVFDDQYSRLYIVADDPATFDHWESPSGHMYLIDGHNGTSAITIETSFNLLGQSPTFEAVHTGGSPTPDLVTIDRRSGAGSIIGSLSGGLSTVYPAVAVHPATGVLYAGGGDGSAVLHTVNPVTGTLTPVGAASSGIERIAAMDFHPDGTLFASAKMTGTSSPGANWLATIDISTGAATPVGSFGLCGITCTIEGMGAIAFDDEGTLYGALHERAQNGTPGLYTINTATGSATFVAPIVDRSSTRLSGGIVSLQFAEGTLYGGTAIAKDPPGDGGWLVMIDKTTGVFSKIGASSATGGRGLIGLAPPTPAVRPPNDDLTDAVAAGFLPYVGGGNNTNASWEPSEAFGSCSSDHGNSIWWSFTPTVSQWYEVNTNGSSINTGLSIWTGDTHPLVEIACDDDMGEGAASMLRFDGVAGEQYFFRVIGLAGEEGSIAINVLAPTPPVNDDLVDATPIVSLPSTVFGTNVGASPEPHEELPSCAADVGTAVWWKFTPTETGRVYLDTEGSDFNTVLGIWSGTAHPLDEIACNDDIGVDSHSYSWLTFDATAGESYYIRVSGLRGAEGEIVLHIDTEGLCAIQTEIPTEECEALVDLFVATNGGNWRYKEGWLVTNTPCSWEKVSCNAGHVSRLSMAANNLVGSIPASIGDLSGLTRLDFSFNGAPGYPSLTGPIPESVGNLSNLKQLILLANMLTGTIPESIGNLSNLTELWMDYNRLTGPIPESIGNLGPLRFLYLGANYLEGVVPLSVAKVGSAAEDCNLQQDHPGLCIPDIPEYQALASGGKICWLPLDPTCGPIVHAKVFLEGPYSDGGMQARPSFTDHCPSQQPYSDPVFDGTPLDCDHPDVVMSPPDSVMDWVLVSLRTDVSHDSEVPGSERAAFLLTNGSIVDTSGTTLAFPGVAPGAYRLVVRHRNHASVMSADTLDLSTGFGSWNFTTAMTQAYSVSGAPMKLLPDGRFGMFACDANVDGHITAPDFNLWNAKTTAGATGYEQADCNLDGHVTAPDFNLWNANTTAGASSQVPD